jgi:hypothetical protein
MRKSMKLVIAAGISLVIVLMAIVALGVRTPVQQDRSSAVDTSAPADDSADDAVNGQPIVNDHITGRVGTVRHSVGAHAGPTQPSGSATSGGAVQPPATNDSVSHDPQDEAVADTGNTNHSDDHQDDAGTDNGGNTGNTGNTGGTGSTDTGGSTGGTGSTDTGGSTGSTGGTARRTPPRDFTPATGDALQECVATNCFNR